MQSYIFQGNDFFRIGRNLLIQQYKVADMVLDGVVITSFDFLIFDYIVSGIV